MEAEAALPKAARTQEQPATQFIGAIGQLYAIEDQTRTMNPAERQARRQQDSKPILARIAALLQVHLHSTVPNSLLGQAHHFAALSDATRRGVLEQLVRADASITDLADKFHMTLTGVKKHVGVLE